ncbi:unnamed protein product, partial [Ilex paraguariensis]
VEKFMTDMTKHKVVVTGRINPEKVLKKLKKKTGKRAEIVINKEDPKNDAKEEDSALQGTSKQVADCLVFDYFGDCLVYTMFSDENPNACSIM